MKQIKVKRTTVKHALKTARLSQRINPILKAHFASCAAKDGRTEANALTKVMTEYCKTIDPANKLN